VILQEKQPYLVINTREAILYNQSDKRKAASYPAE